MISYNHKIWQRRYVNRVDISTYLVHLTKKTEKETSVDVLINILNQRKLLGSSTERGFIIGKNTAVCFQDIPIYGVTQNLFHEQENREAFGGKIRYSPVGLSFPKRYIFNLGGRPVIYEQKEKAQNLLKEDEWWRIVSMDLTDEERIVDWTHEREWRIKGDLEFDIDKVTVLLTNSKIYSEFIEKCNPELIKSLGGLVTLQNVLF